jgi:chemotaxis response regulator CheB
MAPESTPPPGVVGLGASAGGVEALTSVVAGLPPSFEAAVLVVLHLSATSYSALPAILTRAGPLPARHAEDGERLVAGRIYVAPPGRHLVVADGAAGLAAIKHHGGHALVQTPDDAAFPDMPAAAIRGALPDAVCPAAGVYECLRGWLDAILVAPPDDAERRAQLLRRMFDKLVTDPPTEAPDDGDGDGDAGR